MGLGLLIAASTTVLHFKTDTDLLNDDLSVTKVILAKVKVTCMWLLRAVLSGISMSTVHLDMRQPIEKLQLTYTICRDVGVGYGYFYNTANL